MVFSTGTMWALHDAFMTTSIVVGLRDPSLSEKLHLSTDLTLVYKEVKYARLRP